MCCSVKLKTKLIILTLQTLTKALCTDTVQQSKHSPRKRLCAGQFTLSALFIASEYLMPDSLGVL